MLKARAGDMMFFGLSERNIELLRKGRPIHVDLTDIGMKGEVIIFYGVDEEDCRKILMEAAANPEVPKDKLNG